MDFFDSLRVLRRRWLVVIAALLAGIAAGWVSAPGAGAPTTYQATHTMIVNPASGGFNLNQAALLVTTGAVPVRVAEQFDLEPTAVASKLSGAADPELASLTVTARDGDREQAEALADAAAEELVVELSGSSLQRYEQDLERVRDQVAAARDRVAELQEVPGAEDGSNATASSELQAARSELTSALQSEQDHARQGPPEPPLRTVEQARARNAEADGFNAPDGKPQRAALLGAFGLLLGIGAAFALDRLDTRIHSRRTAEGAFGFPVVAEIPPLPRHERYELLALTRPAAPFVEAHRALRTTVDFDALTSGTAGSGRVVLVTSPMAGEGKTTTAANLAVMLAEVGHTVLLVSADFRRPRLHAYFDLPREPGLTEALGSGSGAQLADLVHATDVDGLHLLPSGAPVENPASMVERLGVFLRAARNLFDYVLVDGPPLLVANDASVLAQEADAVLVLARSGRTTLDAAERASDILRRLEIPVTGVVFTAAGDTPSAYRYYRYRYYTEAEAPRRSFLPFRRHKGASSSNGRRQADAEQSVTAAER